MKTKKEEELWEEDDSETKGVMTVEFNEKLKEDENDDENR